MPTTPTSNSVPPNKFSPFGGAISKSLLTPCRRVGLSRKRKTPNSVLKLPSDTAISLDCSISSPLRLESTPVINESKQSKMNFDSPLKENMKLIKDCEITSTTPVNIRNRKNKRKSKMNFDSPIENETLKGTDHEKITRVDNGDSKAKKSLALEGRNINASTLENVVDSPSSKITDEKMEFNHKLNGETENKLEKSSSVASRNTKFDNDSIVHSKNSSAMPLPEDDSSSCDSLIIPKSKKARVLYDSDEDFLPIQNKTKLNRTKSETPTLKKAKSKLISKTNSENVVNTLKNCRISLTMLSEDEVMKNNSNYLSDDEVVAKVKKKKLVIVSDDEDDLKVGQITNISPVSEVNFIRTSIYPAVTKSENKITSLKENTPTKKPSFVDILEDEDDAFTSTPDKDKNEKKELIEKITVLEKQSKEKKKMLENLKQASVYKSIHNIEELEQLTNKFREGCVKGLNGLLTQLQAHGPINMNTLLSNLHIPAEMISRLSINEES